MLIVTDPRKELITITLTAEEWDSLGFIPEVIVGDPFGEREARTAFYDERSRWYELRTYASEGYAIQSRARGKIGAATQDGVRARYDLAKAEADALRPDVMAALPQIRECARRMVDWYYHGDKTGVSHLGAGNGFEKVGTTGLTCNVLPGMPHMIFYLPEVKFGRSYPYFRFTEEEVAAIKTAVSEVCTITETWNELTNHIGIKFAP